MKSKIYWSLLASEMDVFLGNEKELQMIYANLFDLTYSHIIYLHNDSMVTFPSHVCQYARNVQMYVMIHYLYEILIGMDI